MTLEARRARFRWDDTPLHWIPGDPHTAKVIDVLHLLLPAGERWFARMLNQALPHVDDPQLRADIAGFVRQEGWHARSHGEVVEHLARHGIDVAPFTRELDDLFDRILADRPFGRTLPRWLQRPWLGFRVAAIAGIEHYTCVLGAWALESRGLDDAGADPMMLDLIRWHAAEEVEHRTISFDASRHLGVGWAGRQLAFVFVVPLLWYVWTQGARYLARRDPTPARPRPSWRAVIRAGRQDRLPTIGSLVRATLRFVSPFYHPRREGSLARATEYLARSPAARAAA